MDIELKGTSIIGFQRGSQTGETFTAFDPTTGGAIEPKFYSASIDELNRAAELADDARILFGNTSGRERAKFLRKVADNIEALGLGGVTRIFRRDATKLGPAHPLEPFSLVFLDPPYGKGFAEKALRSAHDGGWLRPEALVVVEEAASAKFMAPEGFQELERRTYDDTEFVFIRHA